MTHILSNIPAPDLAELAGLLVDMAAPVSADPHEPTINGVPWSWRASIERVVNFTRRLATRPAPVAIVHHRLTSTAKAAVCDATNTGNDTTDRDRATCPACLSAPPDDLPSDEELLSVGDAAWDTAPDPDDEGGGNGQPMTTIPERRAAYRAVATLTATRARAAWGAERASLVAVIDAERGYGHGMTPADAVRDLGRMYRDLSQRYMALDATWGEAEDECKGLRASVVQGAEREAFLASSLRDGIAERARLTAQVESLTAALAEATNLDSRDAEVMEANRARRAAEAKVERLTARLAVPEDVDGLVDEFGDASGDLETCNHGDPDDVATAEDEKSRARTALTDAFAALRERAEMAERERGAKVLTVERLAEAMRSHDNERGGPYDESEAAGLFRHLVGPVAVPDRAEELARAMCDVTYERRGSSDFLLIPWSRTNAEQRAGAIDTARAAIARLAFIPAQPAPTPAFGRVTRTVAPPVVLVDDEPAPTHDAAWQAEAVRLVDGVEQAAALRRRHPQMGDADTGGLTAARSALLRHLGIPEQAEGGGEG